MCEIATIGMALSVGSSILGGVQANAQGRAQAGQYEAQARIEEQRARIDAATERTNFRRHLGTVRARTAASGATSGGDVEFDDLVTAEREVSVILQGGHNRAANLRTQGNIARAEGRSKMIGSFISAASQPFSLK